MFFILSHAVMDFHQVVIRNDFTHTVAQQHAKELVIHRKFPELAQDNAELRLLKSWLGVAVKDKISCYKQRSIHLGSLMISKGMLCFLARFNISEVPLLEFRSL